MWALMFLKYFPVVLQAVASIEQVYASQPGASKKKLALGAIAAAAGVAETAPNPEIDAIGGLIDDTVTDLNNSGIFTHAAAAPVAKAA